MSHSRNPFNKKINHKYWVVAEMLLAGEPVTFDDMKASVAQAIGPDAKLSPRSLAVVLRKLEDQRESILRQRDKVWGSVYLLDESLDYDPEFRLSKTTGPDALNESRARADETLDRMRANG